MVDCQEDDGNMPEWMGRLLERHTNKVMIWGLASNQEGEGRQSDNKLISHYMALLSIFHSFPSNLSHFGMNGCPWPLPTC